MLFDTHAHLNHIRYMDQLPLLMENIRQAGVGKVMNVATGMTSNAFMRVDLEPYSNEADLQIGFAHGLHPSCVGNGADAYLDHEAEKKLRTYARRQGTWAMKTGLDRYYQGNEARQELWFRKIVEISLDAEKPLVIHSREAYEETLKILDEFSSGQQNEKFRGILHCFVGNKEDADEFMKRGFLLGIGGKVTNPKFEGLRETVSKIPLNKIVLETDCPYIRSKGGAKLSSPADLPLIRDTVAALHETSAKRVELVTSYNAERLLCPIRNIYLERTYLNGSIGNGRAKRFEQLWEQMKELDREENRDGETDVEIR